MRIEEIIHAWKDPEFRGRMAQVGSHPSGLAEVSDSVLKTTGGASNIGGTCTVGVSDGCASNNGCGCGGTGESGCQKCVF